MEVKHRCWHNMCVYLNLMNKTLKKVTIPICFKEVNNKRKEELVKLLFMIVNKNKLSSFLTSCSTDHASAILGVSIPFKGFNISPFFWYPCRFFYSSNSVICQRLNLRYHSDSIEENSLLDLLKKEDLRTLIDNEEEILNNDIDGSERLLLNDCSITIVENLVELIYEIT